MRPEINDNNVVVWYGQDGTDYEIFLAAPFSQPILSINDVTVNEDAGTAQFTITSTMATGIAITVDYATSDGTAQADSDYTASSATATIFSGNTSTSVSVPIIDDTIYEGTVAETFNVTLSNPSSNATISDDLGVGTIYDNDPPPPYTVYEDGEDGATNGWSIFDNNPSGATISNIYDTERGSRVIALSGSGTANGYEFRLDDGTPWNNPVQFVLEWSMKCASELQVYVEVETSEGIRYLYYTPVDTDYLGTGTYVHHGLGSGVCDGEWHTFLRDLEADLQAAQPSVTIFEVEGMYIRGDVRFDDIRLYIESPPTLSINDVTIDEGGGSMVFTITSSQTSDSAITVDYTTSDGTAEAGFDYVTSSGTATIGIGLTSANVSVSITDDTAVEGDEVFFMDLSNADNAVILDSYAEATIPSNDLPSGYTVYEDAEDGDTTGWSIFDQTPAGATISNVYDTDQGSRVIALSGSGIDNGYLFEDGNPWNNTTQTGFRWSMSCSGDFQLFVELDTSAGVRYLYYTPSDTDTLSTGAYVRYGLGSDTCDSQWHTFDRDLVADLQAAQPSVTINEVDMIYILGSINMDDIILY